MVHIPFINNATSEGIEMGYTHYWRRPVGMDFSENVWKTLCEDVNRMIAALPKNTDTAGGAYRADPLFVVPEASGDTSRIVTETAIGFNGDDGPEGEGKEYADLSHETIVIEKNCPPQPDYRRGDSEYFAFCKTARKPYDLLVVAVLFRARMLVNWLDVSSDGYYNEWLPGMLFAQEVLGKDTIPDSEIEAMRDILGVYE